MDLASVDQHRAELNAITTLASNSTTTLAQSVASGDPQQAAGQLREAVPAIVDTYGGVAATSGALFYENNRPEPGWNARLATPSIADALTGELGWAFVPLFVENDDPIGSLVSRLSGVVQKYVAQYDRDTLALNSSIDETAGGIRRYARSDACAFCAYLSTIDATVHETTVWHNHCHCVTVPWWQDNPLPVNPHEDAWTEAVDRSRAAIQADYRAKRKLAPDLRIRDFYKKFPETAINTSNILAGMRADLGLSH